MTYYDLLGVRPGVGLEDLRRAYLRAARRTHPDGGGTDAAFREVQVAWATLSDPRRRAAYDVEHYLRPAPGRSPAPDQGEEGTGPEEEWRGFSHGPLGRSVRLSVLGPVGLSGALTSSVLAMTWPPLLLVGAAYVVATMLAVARRVHPPTHRWLRWPGTRTYRVLLVGAWVVVAGFLVLGVAATALDTSPTTPLLWAACATTFAIATTVAGELGVAHGS